MPRAPRITSRQLRRCKSANQGGAPGTTAASSRWCSTSPRRSPTSRLERLSSMYRNGDPARPVGMGQVHVRAALRDRRPAQGMRRWIG
jgi:hypothetical protein